MKMDCVDSTSCTLSGHAAPPQADALYDTELYETDANSRRINAHRGRIGAALSQTYLAFRVTRVLEIGCGQGYVTRQLSEWFSQADIFATDPAWNRLSSWQPQPSIRRFSADGCKLPCPDSTFDLVVLWSVLDHIDKFREALSEVSRVVRRDGWVLVNSSLFARFVRLQRPDPLTHYQYFSYPALLSLIRGCGFRVIAVRGNGFPCQLYHRRLNDWKNRLGLRGFPRLLRHGLALLMNPYGATKVFPWLFGPLNAVGRLYPRLAFDVTVLAQKGTTP